VLSDFLILTGTRNTYVGHRFLIPYQYLMVVCIHLQRSSYKGKIVLPSSACWPNGAGTGRSRTFVPDGELGLRFPYCGFSSRVEVQDVACRHRSYLDWSDPVPRRPAAILPASCPCATLTISFGVIMIKMLTTLKITIGRL
jgi:hypothetical protein